MKLSNGEIHNATAPLARLMEQKFPIQLSYRLAKLAAILDPQLLVIEKVRAKLIQTYGEQDPDKPQQMRVNPNSESFPKFAEEYGILMSQEVEIEVEVVDLPNTLEIEPSVLMALDRFIRLGTN